MCPGCSPQAVQGRAVILEMLRFPAGLYSVTEPQEYVWSEGHSHVTLLATLCIHFILTQGTRMNVASLTLWVSL